MSNDLYHEMIDSGVINPEDDSSKWHWCTPDERTSRYVRVALTGLTQAEYFRDEEGQDVLFFVDNIFRFARSSEVSALLGRIPSAVGLPTLATDMGAMREPQAAGSITSVQLYTSGG